MAIMATLGSVVVSEGRAASNPAEAWAVAQQEQLPEYAARTTTARSQIAARSAYLGGEGAAAVAFPHLALQAIGAPSVAQGHLDLLDERAIARAQERSAATPDLEDAKRVAMWRQARDTALQAESDADDLTRRAIIGVLAQLRAHPELGHRRVLELTQPLRDHIDEAEAAEALEGSEGESPHLAALRMEAARSASALDRVTSLVEALRVVSLTGVVPEPAEDITALAGDDAEGAALRLTLLGPHLADPEARDALEQALSAYWGGGPLEGAQTAVGVATNALERAGAGTSGDLGTQDAADAAHAAALEALEGVADGPGSQAHRAVLQLRVDAADLHRQAVALWIDGRTIGAGEEAQRAKTEAQVAEDEAKAARDAANNTRDQRIAAALTDYAAARTRSAELWEQTKATQERNLELRATIVDRLAPIKRHVEQLQALSTLDPTRPDADAVYRDLRTLLGDFRAGDAARGENVYAAEAVEAKVATSVEQDRRRIQETRDVFDSLTPEEREKMSATLTAWEEVLQSQERAAAEWMAAATDERDDLLRALHDARGARRAAYRFISRSQREADRTYFLEDIYRELALLGPSVFSMLRGRLGDLVALPFTLTDFNVLRGLMVSSFWTVLVAVGWWWARSQAGTWALSAANRVRKYRTDLRLADVRALREPTARFIRNTVDLAVGRLLVWSLGETLPEIQFLLLVYLQVALYRALLAGFDLAAVPSTVIRPAVVVVREEVYRLARQTVRVALGYLIAKAFLEYVLWDVLGLDTISTLVAAVFALVFWGLLAWMLWRWEPVLRERMARRNQESRLVAWLSRDDLTAFLRIPRAIGIVVFFAVAAAVDLFYRFARDGTSLAWAFNAVNRFRLAEVDDVETQPLAEDIVLKLTQGETLAKHAVTRVELDVVDEVVVEWNRTNRRGLVAVVGDRGTGKGMACTRVQELLEKQELTVVRASLDDHVTDPTELLQWLCDLADLSAFDTVDGLVDALHGLERRAFLLEHVHRCFSRKVGGLDAITQLLYVLNATSDRHFFVVSVHGPAWEYFSSVGSLVDCGVFHTVIRLAPLTSQQLRDLTLGRTGSAGLRVDFSGLTRANALGADPEVELERATTLFYRLLAEASQGSPSIALQLWARCLQPTDDPREVKVRMGASLNPGVIRDLSDSALFVLMALYLQDGLPEYELAQVTNLSPATVRSTVRDLRSRALVTRHEGWVYVADSVRPAVQRTLRRRHFLHLGV